MSGFGTNPLADPQMPIASTAEPHLVRGIGSFEDLTLDPTTHTLYAMLQSATIQDGTLQYTRLLAYNVSAPSTAVPLVGEWIVPLPVSSKGKVEASSEIHFVGGGVFLCLARDGNGHGGSGNDIKYKHADLFSIVNATDIHGTPFDSPATPAAPKGTLSKKIVPATYVSFVDYADPDCDPDDNTLLDAKWESLALAPVGDSAPNDFFLFTASDNDFLSTQGVSLGVPFNAGEDVDNQFLVFRVTLHGASAGVNLALGL
ncbi:hypothetical protein C8R44DRAFT_767236 [Mycena epipterygia]|nr:hypothetical protein C8R44DRAFT_767236 [Mycena epipterygia]